MIIFAVDARNMIDEGKSLEFDLSITLYKETDGDIRVVYSGPVS